MQAGALMIGTDAFFNSQIEQLAALAIRNSVLAIYAISPVRGCRRPGELWRQHHELLSPRRSLRRPNSQGRETRQPAGPAGNKSRTDHQPQDREGAGHYRAAVGAKPRRRGDRISRNVDPLDVRFRG